MITTTQVVITNKFDLELINIALTQYYESLGSTRIPSDKYSVSASCLSKELENVLGRVDRLRNSMVRVLESNVNIAEPEEATK